MCVHVGVEVVTSYIFKLVKITIRRRAKKWMEKRRKKVLIWGYWD